MLTTCWCFNGKMLLNSPIIRCNFTAHAGYYRFNSAITAGILLWNSYKMIMDYILLRAFIHLPRFLLRCYSQFPSSTLATQTTTWMRAMASWRFRCGGQELIFPKVEPSQCAPERQILFQLRVCLDSRRLSLTAIAKCKTQKTKDLSCQPVNFCLPELRTLRRGLRWICWVDELGNVNIVLGRGGRSQWALAL